MCKNIDGDSLEDMADVWEAKGSRSLSARIDGRWIPQLGSKYMVLACSGEFPVSDLRITSKAFPPPEMEPLREPEQTSNHPRSDKAWGLLPDRDKIIKVALLYGWTHICNAEDSEHAACLQWHGKAADTLTGTTPDGTPFTCIPDYINDLNAMHEIEMSLTREDAWFYYDQLGEICECNNQYDYRTEQLHHLVSAKCPQRAKAFVMMHEVDSDE